MVESALVIAPAEGEFSCKLAHYAADAVRVLEVRTYGADSALATERGVTLMLSSGEEFRLTVAKVGS
jgi:hypothetical protein